MLPYAFATLAEFKRRLGITDTVDDTLLQELLNGTAGVIESAAGRTLRRDHARTEYFRGGNRLIQTDLAPIAKVHSIRESSTRDFETSGEYEELEEGTDYVLDPGPDGGRPGENGFIRRLNSKWMGSEISPGQVRVVYTGGFVTDDEIAAQSSGEILDLRQNSRMSLLLPSRNYWLDAEAGHYLSEPATVSQESLAVTVADECLILLVFDVRGWLSPGSVFSFLSVSAGAAAGGGPLGSPAGRFYLLPAALRPDMCTPAQIVAGLTDAVDYGSFVAGGGGGVLASTSFVYPLKSAANEVFLRDAVASGFLSFVVKADAGEGELSVATPYCSTTAYRPGLNANFVALLDTAFGVPADLRNANLLQAVHEYRTKAMPGMISQSLRASTVASGASYLKTAADLLPEVRDIAMRYRRMF